MSNSLDIVQARQFVGPGLGPNSCQMLSADDKGSMLYFPLLNFSKFTFQKIFHNNNHSVKQLVSRTGSNFVGPGLGPNSLKRLSADDKSCMFYFRLLFSKIYFFKKLFQNNNQSVKRLGSRIGSNIAGPDPGPN